MPTGTSYSNKRIRMATASYAAATYPVGPVVTRDVVSNNLDHYADSFGQVRLCYSGGAVGHAAEYMTYSVTPVANTWYSILASNPFPAPVRTGGDSYRFLVRLAGASSVAGKNAKLAVVIAPLTQAEGILVASSTDSVFETGTTSSTSVSWLTGASQGDSAYTTMVGLTAAEVAAYATVTATPVDLAGDDSAVPQCLVQAVVFGQTDDASAVARLYACHVMEWIG